MSSKRDHFTFSFLILMCFVSFSFWCLNDLPRTSSTLLNRIVENEHICLFSDLKGKSFSFHQCVWCELWDFHIWPLLYWDKFLLHWFVDSFCRGCVWNFIKCFTFMYWYECVIFILHSANVVYHIYWGAYGGPFFQYNNNRLSKKIIKKTNSIYNSNEKLNT